MFDYSVWLMFACGAILTCLFILRFSETDKKTRCIRAVVYTASYLVVFALYLWVLSFVIDSLGIVFYFFSVVPLCSLIFTGHLLNKNIL